MKEMTISSQFHRQVIDITQPVEAMVDRQSWQNGCLSLWLAHTTASLTTADLDPGTDQDLLDFLEAITPDLNWRHPHNPGHAPAHLLSSIIGHGLNLPVRGGQLQLGTWQRIVLLEFDGPKSRQMLLNWCSAT
jgi:secondary thiamine-phosphate synthase enzyme